jgi:hypothetical protein
MTPEAQITTEETNEPRWENLLPYMLKCYLELPKERKVIEEQMAAFGKKVDEAVVVANKEKANG